MKVEIAPLLSHDGIQLSFVLNCVNCGAELHRSDSDSAQHPINNRVLCQFQGKTIAIPVIIEVETK